MGNQETTSPPPPSVLTALISFPPLLVCTSVRRIAENPYGGEDHHG
jgi:hypothetical protein